MNYKKNILLLLIVGSCSACTSKSSFINKNEENRNMSLTEVEALETGMIVGAIIGKVSGAEIVTSTVVGAAVGLGVGNKLLEMQFDYLSKENYLIDKISKSVENQKELSKDMDSLREKMSQLNGDIESIKQMDNTITNKDAMVTKIELKREKIENLKALNNGTIDDILEYKNLLSYSKYPDEKKQEVKKRLDAVLTELFSLRKKCKENLTQLDNLEKRIF